MKARYVRSFMKARYLLLALFLFDGCGDLLFDLNHAIKKFGYIPYTTPLQYAGTGTLISGDAAHLEVLSAPETCFPTTVDLNGVPTLLRRVDDTSLPSQTKTISIEANAMARFFNVLSVGTPSIKASAHTQNLKSFTFSFGGAHMEFIDAVALKSYYPFMNESCKTYLNLVGFIIQAIRIEKMSFTFYEKNDGNVAAEVDHIQAFLDVAADVTWHVENKVNLVIDTPKYIGYQIGSLRSVDNGVSLYRATSTIFNKFIFKKITDIPTDDNDGLGLEDHGITHSFPVPKNKLGGFYWK